MLQRPWIIGVGASAPSVNVVYNPRGPVSFRMEVANATGLDATTWWACEHAVSCRLSLIAFPPSNGFLSVSGESPLRLSIPLPEPGEWEFVLAGDHRFLSLFVGAQGTIQITASQDAG